MKAEDKWVKVKILKHMISIYGSHFPGAIVTIPLRVAKNWVVNGIAERVEIDVPKGMFWCTDCGQLHKKGTKIGKNHLKRMNRLQEEANDKADEEALAKAEAEEAQVEAEAEAAVARMAEAEGAPVQEPGTEVKVEEGEEAEVTGDGTGAALPEIEPEK